MPLNTPAFIVHAAVAGQAVTHSWSQGDAMFALGKANPTMEDKLGAVSMRGLLALSATLAEWLRARFEHLNADPLLEMLIEAIWAASVDFRYLKLDALDSSANFGDPVRGPMQECKRLLRRISSIYFDVDYGIVSHTRGLAKLTEYVLPQSKAYQSWFKSVVTRLPGVSAPAAQTSCGFSIAMKKTAPRGVAESVWGTPLPREAMDPAIDLKSVDFAKSIDDLLQKVYRPGNPFLRSPAELAASGMTGTPYRYVKS